MKFNDDMIQRRVWKRPGGPLPRDAFELIHDLAYHLVESRTAESYVKRAQEILKRKTFK